MKTPAVYTALTELCWSTVRALHCTSKYREQAYKRQKQHKHEHDKL